MQALKLKKKSWHYWVATQFGGYKEHMASGSFCGYVFDVLWGMFLMAVLGYYASIMGFALFDGLRFVILSLLNRFAHTHFTTHITEAGAVLSSITLGFAVFLGLVYGIVKLNDRYRDNKPYKSSKSFFINAFRTFRSKTCSKVEFE